MRKFDKNDKLLYVSGEKRMDHGGDGGRSASAHLYALSFSDYFCGTVDRTTIWSRAISHRGTAIYSKLVIKSLLTSANLASRANVCSFLTKKKKNYFLSTLHTRFYLQTFVGSS